MGGRLNKPIFSSNQTQAMLAAVWNRNRQTVLHRLESIDAFLASLSSGAQPAQQREDARNDAHKLAGSLGMFGLEEGTMLARRIEHALAPGLSLDAGDALPLSKAAARLRQLIEHHHLGMEQPGITHGHRVLVLEGAEDVADSLITEARRRGMRATGAADLEAASRALRQSQFDLLIMDLGTVGLNCGVSDDRRSDQVRDIIMSHAPMQVVALTSSDTFEDRVTAAQVGAHGFLPKNVPAGEILDNCVHLLDLQNAHFKILAVDDDAATLDQLKSILNRHSMRLTTVSDPRLFWEALQDTAPDLVILDTEMPDFSGIELCRAIRSDNTWRRVPVLFLSSNVDAETVTQIYNAGADDFVAKPIIEIELLTRVRNRLERDRLYRSFSDFDPLTGVRNRRSSNVSIANYLRLAERHVLPVSLVVLDLDKFKRVNDTYGHQAGDDVLQFLGGLLKQSFRSEDVVARWGGEEFVIAMLAMRRGDAIERVADVLDRTEEHTFEAPEGTLFHVSFSAGVAEFPVDGTDLHSLYRFADEALYRAKAAGGGRILSLPKRAEEVEIAIVTGNPAKSAGLRRSLEMRGYNVELFGTGDAAAELGGGSQNPVPLVVFDEVDDAEIQNVLPGLGEKSHPLILATQENQAAFLVAERLVKPYKATALMHRVRRMLGK